MLPWTCFQCSMHCYILDAGASLWVPLRRAMLSQVKYIWGQTKHENSLPSPSPFLHNSRLNEMDKKRKLNFPWTGTECLLLCFPLTGRRPSCPFLSLRAPWSKVELSVDSAGEVVRVVWMACPHSQAMGLRNTALNLSPLPLPPVSPDSYLLLTSLPSLLSVGASVFLQVQQLHSAPASLVSIAHLVLILLSVLVKVFSHDKDGLWFMVIKGMLIWLLGVALWGRWNVTKGIPSMLMCKIVSYLCLLNVR